MNEIKAFVGHSFSPEDQEVVRKFLDYFTQVSGSLSHFSWTHAQHAEPIGIVDKVLGLIEDCNTFIAIVTKKERVIAPNGLSPSMLNKTKYIVDGSRLEWKTSDWVIQEIGLAIGRGLFLIILLEDGCRKPGDLDGNIEFIPFRREAPSDAFGQLLEMLSSLSPPARLQGGQAAADPSEPQLPSTDVVRDESDLTPEPSWGKERYEGALIRHLISGHKDEADAITAAYLSTPEGKNLESQAEWNAKYEFWKILLSNDGSIQRVKEQVELARTSSTLESYGSALSKFGESEEVGEQFLAAAEISTGHSEKARLLVRAAHSFANSGVKIRALGAINEIRSIVTKDPSLETFLLDGVRRIAEIQKDWELWLEATERLVEINPDSEDRFQLAYRHSEAGRNDLALMHYNNIPSERRTDMAWNNLGVGLDRFNMPAKAASSYARAVDMGSSLAMSNVGYKYLNAGFIEHAAEMFKKGVDAEYPHSNAAEGLAKVQRINDEESARFEEIIGACKRKADFYKRLGRAISASTPEEVSGLWQSPVANLQMTISEGRITFYGEYEQAQQNALHLHGANRSVKRSIRYEGTIVGRRAAGVVKRTSDAPTSLMAIGSEGDEFAMIFEDSGHISVMENPKSPSPVFYDLQRV